MDYPVKTGKNVSHLYLLKIIFFAFFGYEIDLLTLHMTLNYQNNNRDYPGKIKVKKMY